jgi:hypothetical protein
MLTSDPYRRAQSTIRYGVPGIHDISLRKNRGPKKPPNLAKGKKGTVVKAKIVDDADILVWECGEKEVLWIGLIMRPIHSTK